MARQVPVPTQRFLSGHQMITSSAITATVAPWLSLSWLTGPIFDKELRVSSRRRRNYVLRSAYLVLLMVYLIPFSSILAFGVLNVAALAIGTIVFLCGTGLYVSSRLRQTSAAVAANFVLAASVWGILHLSLASLVRPFRPSYRQSLLDCFWDTVPFVQAMETVWSRRHYGSGGTTPYVLGYILIGILFAWRAKCQFRRNVFHHVL